MADYIRWIRSKVGHSPIFLNFSAAILTNSKGEVLMNRRGDSNLWGMIGGCIEIGETFEEALRREVREETGVEHFRIVSPMKTYMWQAFKYPNGDVAQTVEHWFVCEVDDDVDLSYRDEETLELRWIDLENMEVELFNKNHEKIMEDYQKGEFK